ncbi:GNAT family N-acetyltransferase [Pedobacter heparinus]|uniref:GNAT family N-acetyltransferase n=1 Tax=Pedobacter heparinus TaxID=984 RepID=UPI0029314223|nr:GNAT family N-acetyltransferase [Pedobacter heparinus]
MIHNKTMILRKAHINQLPVIWEIIQQAIEQRRQEGSAQWQNGYPNENTIINDIEKGYGYIFLIDEVVVAYAAIIFDIEPAYEVIEGKWLTNDGDYVNIHRIAVSASAKGKGVATRLLTLIEQLAADNKIYSIKIDTNFDNEPMLKILNKLGYTYCGEVLYQGASRRAYEKVLI